MSTELDFFLSDLIFGGHLEFLAVVFDRFTIDPSPGVETIVVGSGGLTYVGGSVLGGGGTNITFTGSFETENHDDSGLTDVIDLTSEMRVSFSVFVDRGLGEIGFALAVGSGTGAGGTQKAEIGIGQGGSVVFGVGHVESEASDICGFLDDLFISVGGGQGGVDFSGEHTFFDVVFTEKSVTRMTF